MLMAMLPTWSIIVGLNFLIFCSTSVIGPILQLKTLAFTVEIPQQKSGLLDTMLRGITLAMLRVDSRIGTYLFCHLTANTHNMAARFKELAGPLCRVGSGFRVSKP